MELLERDAYGSVDDFAFEVVVGASRHSSDSEEFREQLRRMVNWPDPAALFHALMKAGTLHQAYSETVEELLIAAISQPDLNAPPELAALWFAHSLPHADDQGNLAEAETQDQNSKSITEPELRSSDEASQDQLHRSWERANGLVTRFKQNADRLASSVEAQRQLLLRLRRASAFEASQPGVGDNGEPVGPYLPHPNEKAMLDDRFNALAKEVNQLRRFSSGCTKFDFFGARREDVKGLRDGVRCALGSARAASTEMMLLKRLRGGEYEALNAREIQTCLHALNGDIAELLEKMSGDREGRSGRAPADEVRSGRR